MSQNSAPTILGVSASLRNARFGRGSEELCEQILAIEDKDALRAYLVGQAEIRTQEFFDAGRKDKLPFDEIYRNLSKVRHARGLSNSEAGLAAGLWGASQVGADIRHVGLSRYFPASGGRQHLEELRAEILKADGILLSGPVYFGDRGSLAHEFIEYLRDDADVAEHIRGRVYAGITVGAKRNGGQETTLIYQMIDLANLNMLVVGNDSESTSQYGGTIVGGDVGTAVTDEYGITTAIGTGRRIGRIANFLTNSTPLQSKPTNISIWLIQDDEDHHGRAHLEQLLAEVEQAVPQVRFQLKDYTEEYIYRCIACDICPIKKGPREEYRCIIKNGNDLFANQHADIIDTDAILLAAYSPVARAKLRSVYQQFIERTRYLRRDDYFFSDRLVAPLVISEMNARQNLHIRMLTSLIRHHTVLHHPLIGMEQDGAVLNWENLKQQTISFALNAARLASGREIVGADYEKTYNPVGYVISAEQAKSTG